MSKPAKSILAAAFQKAESKEKGEKPTENEDLTANLGDESDDSSEEQNEEPDSQEEESDEDIRLPLGASPKASEQWEKLKGNIGLWKGKFTEAETKLKEAERKLAEVTAIEERLKAIEEESNQRKKTIDDIQFESSDEFKEAFIAPIQTIASKAEKLFDPDLSQQQIATLGRLNTALTSIAGKEGKESQFYKIVDEMAEEGITSNAAKTKFESLMSALWDKSAELLSVRSAKEKTRDEILKKNGTGIEAAMSQIESELDLDLSEFETSNAQRVKFWASDDLKDIVGYKGKDDPAFGAAKKEISAFLKTRKATPELRKILLAGAMSHTYEKETKLLRDTIAFQTNKIKELEKSLASKGISMPKSRPNGSSSKKDDKIDYSRSVLAQAMAEAE